MPAVTVELIKSLREQTGAGISDCKQALEDNGGNLEQAHGGPASRRALSRPPSGPTGRPPKGWLKPTSHTGGRVGAMVQLGCETDFVARTEGFRTLAHDIAMQVAAMSPVYLNEEDMDEGDDRPAAQVCLMQQPFIKDGSRTLADLVRETAAQTGENVRVVNFRRLALGE